MKKLKMICILLAAASFAFASGSSEENSSATSGNEKTVLNYVYSNVAFNPADEPIKDTLEEVTGYEVVYHMLPADNPAMKLNMELASGTSYDIVRISTDWFANLVSQNALQPLNDLIDEYGPNIKEHINPEFFDATTVNGKIYGIPNGTANPYGVYWGIAFRQDILDEYGIALPADLDSFTECLREIKEKTGLIPLTTTEPVIDHILSAFSLSTYAKDVDGQIVLRPQQEGMYEYLAYMRNLYEEGLIDTDLPINKKENVQEKFVSGQAVACLITYGSETPMEVMMPALKANFPDCELSYILPLKDENGERQVPQLAGVTDMVVIPVSSTHAVDVIKYLDSTLIPENSKLLAIGEEGIHYSVSEDGTKMPILPEFFEDRGNSWWLVPLNDSYEFPTYWAELRIRKNEDVYNAFRELSRSAEYGQIDPAAYMPLTEVRAEYETKLKNMERDYYIQVICGAVPLSDYDSFVQRWLDAGGRELTEEINNWYSSR